MSKKIKFTIDGQECTTNEGQFLVDAAKENGIYIPTLCNKEGLKPKAGCRICTVKVNERLMTACTTPVQEGMQVESDTDELLNLRKSIVELLFVEGNHLCPSCEKSGNCELQALAYRFRMTVPRFPYMFPKRTVDAGYPRIIKEQNRCIQCKRCIRGIKDEQGRSIFALRERGHKAEVVVDQALAEEMSDELAQKAMEICPVGSILVRNKAFRTPMGERKYDLNPIGSDIEKKKQ